MSQCSESLRDEGKPYPRTCAVCGLGPCQLNERPKQATIQALSEHRERDHDERSVQKRMAWFVEKREGAHMRFLHMG